MSSPSDRNNKDNKVSSIPLANISIPSNLQEILASLKNVGGSAGLMGAPSQVHLRKGCEDEDEDEEYNPVPLSSSTKMSTETYKPRPTSPSTRAFLLSQEQKGEEIPFLSSSSSSAALVDNSGPSKLSHMTDAELMALVPDGVDLAPPPTVVSSASKLAMMGSVDQMPPGLGDGNDEEYDPSQ